MWPRRRHRLQVQSAYLLGDIARADGAMLLLNPQSDGPESLLGVHLWVSLAYATTS